MEPLTQLEAARKSVVTPAMRRVAERELVTPEFIRDEVARGRMVIPANQRHLAGSGGQASQANGHARAVGERDGGSPHDRHWVDQTVKERTAEIERSDSLRGEHAPKRLDPMGIGRMITTKVNANIGASPVSSSTEAEVEKLLWAQKCGADTLMDLSTGGNLFQCRQTTI